MERFTCKQTWIGETEIVRGGKIKMMSKKIDYNSLKNLIVYLDVQEKINIVRHECYCPRCNARAIT